MQAFYDALASCVQLLPQHSGRLYCSACLRAPQLASSCSQTRPRVRLLLAHALAWETKPRVPSEPIISRLMISMGSSVWKSTWQGGERNRAEKTLDVCWVQTDRRVWLGRRHSCQGCRVCLCCLPMLPAALLQTDKNP